MLQDVFVLHMLPNAAGSRLIECGNTKVIVPSHLKKKHTIGWKKQG
jgi:ribonuclease PH